MLEIDLCPAIVFVTSPQGAKIEEGLPVESGSIGMLGRSECILEIVSGRFKLPKHGSELAAPVVK
jgi:hypothetical protein